jgi:hypothetical protein
MTDKHEAYQREVIEEFKRLDALQQPTPEPRPATLDGELKALCGVIQLIEPLSIDQRRRVLAMVGARYFEPRPQTWWPKGYPQATTA